MAEIKKAVVKEAPKAAETVAVVKEEPKAEAAEKKKPGRKPGTKATATKKAAAPKKTAAAKKTTTAKKTTAKKAAEPKAAAKRGRKAAAKEIVNFQFAGKSYTPDELLNICKDVWKYDLNGKEEDFKSVELYVKPEENTTYYVINGDVTGSFFI